MRACVLRQNADDAVPSTDAWGAEQVDPVPDVVHDALACFAWSPSDDAEVLDEASGTFGAVRLIVPADADVLEGDVVDSIFDRVGRELFAGPMAVTGVTRRASHLAVMVRVQQPGQG